jgi:hypothetical protein
MGLKLLLPILALAAGCHGAALPEAEDFDMDTVMDLVQEFIANPDPYMEAFGVRAKRHVEDLNRAGFKQFPIPFIGAEVGIKYKDPSNRDKGGEAYLDIKDLASLVPRAKSRAVQIHAKFDGGASSRDGLFTMEVDYHFDHKDGSGTEEGSMKIVREKRGGMWHTDIKTEAHPFSGRPIIPTRINNMEFEIESDRATKLKGKYVNPNMRRDITWDIVRQPGKNIKAVITRDGVTSTIEGTLNKSGQDMDIIVKADIRGVKYDGKISVKSAADKTKVDVLIKQGSESVLQMLSEVQIKGSKFRLRTKYSIMGGKVAKGDFSARYQNNKLSFEAAPYKLDIELHLGRSIKVEAFNNGQSMWTYETLREDKSTPAAIQWEANSKMTLNPASKLHKFIQDNYPFGAFQTRTNNFKLFIDRNNRNFILRKFKINFDVVKDGQKVIDISGNTVNSPYQFSASAPNLFERLNIAQNPITLTINHQRGSFLIIDSNIAGGMKLDAKQSPNAGTGGRNIDIVTTKAGTQMWKYHAVTSKVNDANQLKVGLKGDFELNPQSLLYKLVVSKYRILTPFARRHSELEFFWDKKNKNVVMNKFYAKAKVDKDGSKVADVLISTNQQPYKFHAYMPALLGKLRPGMQEVDVDVIHNPGTSLEMKVNHAGAKFKGFKIAKTGSGSEREITWNGKKLAKGDFTLTGKRFTTTQTLYNGKSLTTTITWKNRWDSPNFLLDNKVHVNLDGTERKLDLNMDWGMSKLPDMDLNTPEDGHFKMTAVGQNARWGDYSINRNLHWGSSSRRLSLDVTGDAEFGAGPLAAASPVQTEVKLSFDVNNADLNGKFMKVYAGKEYSVVFQPGFTMPSIKIGA